MTGDERHLARALAFFLRALSGFRIDPRRFEAVLRGLQRRDSDRLHWSIKEQLNESGFGYISSTVLDGRRVLRLVVMNPRTNEDDIVAILRKVEEIAAAVD